MPKYADGTTKPWDAVQWTDMTNGKIYIKLILYRALYRVDENSGPP